MKNLLMIITGLAASIAMSAQANTITYNFDNGTLQGWTNLSSSAAAAGYYDLAFGATTKEQQWDTTTNNPGLGAYFLGEKPGTNDNHSATWSLWPAASSGVHQTLWAESPPFILDGSGALTFFGSGSEGAINPSTGLRNIPFTTIPTVAGTWGAESGNAANTAGTCGVGLRRDDGTFVLTRNFVNWGASWSTYSFSTSELAPFVNDGHAYTLDLIDYLGGTGSWIAIDNVSIPGRPQPATPSNLAATNLSSTQIKLTWTDNATNETSYKIESKTGVGSFTQIATTGANATSYTNTGLNPGVTYVYRVRAANSTDNSPYSSEASATTTGTGSITISDFGFESPALTWGNFQYSPTGGSWNFGGGTGLSQNGSGFTANNPNAPQASQIAFLQGNSAQLSQTLSGFSAGITYTITFAAAQRNYSQVGQTWNVKIDGNVVGSFSPPQSATSYVDYSTTFTTTTGSHELAFQGSNLNGGDNTVFIDNVRITYNSSSLPSPWAHQDIGSVGLAGSASYANPTFTINGSGSDIWDAVDAFHFVYQPWTNDVEITTRVVTQQNTDAWAKTGVMIRETLDANSKHAMMIVTPTSGSSFQRRLTTGGGTSLIGGGSVAAPYWMRLVRSGNTLTAFQSSDGTTWTQVGSDTVSMTSTVYVGLPVTAHNNAALSTCTLDNVTVRTPATVPAAPSGLAATATSTTQINLSWTDNATNETGFKIESKIGSGGTYAQIATVAANTTTYSHTGLTAGTQYYYRVRATNSVGDSAYCSETSATTQSPSSGVGLSGEYYSNVNLTGSPTLTRTDATVGFDWGSGGPDASVPADGFSVRWTGMVQPQYSENYTFYTRTDDGVRLWVNGVQLVNDWTEHPATENSGAIALSAGQKYNITMEYFDSGGGAVAQLSWYSSSTPKAIIPQSRLYLPTTTTAPAAPSGLTATMSSTSQINLAWTDNATNETSYKIERKTGAGGTYAQINSVGANVTTYPDTGLSAGTTYYYRVRASNAGGDSAFCTEASATTSSSTPTDYTGTPFVTDPAPVLSFQRKLSPTLNGIDYTFPEQTAQGVALLSRFPAFTNSASRIHVDGPWYNDPAANLHFSRGITSVGALPNYRLSDEAPTTVRKISPNNKSMLMTDPLWYTLAVNLANQLESQNPSDARIVPLRNLGINHVYTDDQNAYISLGYYGYQCERWSLDINGGFCRYPAIDIETTGNYQYQRNCNGWLYQGMAQAANELGTTIVPNLYGQWQYYVGVIYDSGRYGGQYTTNYPEYLLPEKDFISSADPTMVACQQNNGILSMDGYIQAIWGTEPFYKRNADTSLVLSNGLPIFNDITNSTAYGWNLYMEPAGFDQEGWPVPTESLHCLSDIYRQATRMYLQHHYRAGQYPADSSLRKSFLSNCKIGAWERYSNEGVLGVNQNDRPVPLWLLDALTAMYLFTADDITVWSSDMNFVPGPLGGNYTNAWRYNAHGVLEAVVKAAHRYSANDPLHASTSTYKWCWFNLPMVNQNTTIGDRYFEKPIAFGKLRPFEGHTYLELYIAWPAADNTSKTFKVWVDKNGTRSLAYTAQLQNGRSYFYDAWQLPDSFTGLEGQHIQLRTTDLLGTQRTWCGDWRVNANNTIATPSDY